MKILIHSNAPWAATGYGQQVALFARRFRDAGHDVAISAFYGLEGGIGAWEGMTVYPTDFSRLGKHMLKFYVEDHAKGDPVESVQVITLMDVWPWADGRWGGLADFAGLNVAAWVPIDHDPAPPRVLAALHSFNARPIAMSRFGEAQLKLAGFAPLYVPHGVDTNIFAPLDDVAELKTAMGFAEGSFVVGMVANNQGNGPPRKAFPQLFQAFSRFQQEHEEAFLYLHTDIFGQNEGINLLELAAINGIPERAFGGVEQAKYLVGTIKPHQLARAYAAMDVLASPSYGEGFGIPIIEAQACGVPVIVTDWTAMPELCGSGWKVTGDRWYNSAHGSFWMCPSVFEIYDALEAAYEARNDTVWKTQAREFALTYDADRVMAEHWTPVLAELERSLPVQAENRFPNREARRAKARRKDPAVA